jgi:hypothetical protein
LDGRGTADIVLGVVNAGLVVLNLERDRRWRTVAQLDIGALEERFHPEGRFQRFLARATGIGILMQLVGFDAIAPGEHCVTPAAILADHGFHGHRR